MVALGCGVTWANASASTTPRATHNTELVALKARRNLRAPTKADISISSPDSTTRMTAIPRISASDFWLNSPDLTNAGLVFLFRC